jgi:SAM-dependent methyltransferase
MWSFSTAFVFVMDVLTSTLRNRRREVPWVPTSMSSVHKMLDMAHVGPDDLVYDLGCGDGRMIVTAARRHGARAVGIEIDPLRYLWCQLLITILGLRGRVRVVRDSFYAQDLREADVVTCYLLPSTNEKLQRKLEQELRPGARVVSNDYAFPGLPLVRQDEQARLYLYSLGP